MRVGKAEASMHAATESGGWIKRFLIEEREIARKVIARGAADRACRNLLVGLLAVDGVFIVIHAIRWFFFRESGLLHSRLFDISKDGGLAECANYAQTAVLVALLVRVGRRARQPVYLGWAAL